MILIDTANRELVGKSKYQRVIFHELVGVEWFRYREFASLISGLSSGNGDNSCEWKLMIRSEGESRNSAASDTRLSSASFARDWKIVSRWVTIDRDRKRLK